MALFVTAVVVGAVALALFAVMRRPQTAEAILAWIIKWRFRIFIVFWALSILVALGSGSTLLILYGGVSLAVALVWFFLRGPGRGVL